MAQFSALHCSSYVLFIIFFLLAMWKKNDMFNFNNSISQDQNVMLLQLVILSC